MSYRQRSFFDQKPQGQKKWHRRPYPGMVVAQGEATFTATSKPMWPISASTQSREILGAFRFEQKQDNSNGEFILAASAHPVSEHDQSVDGQSKMQNLTSSQVTARQPLSQITGKEGSRDCPQTPAGRLPLAELVASCEDTHKQNLSLTPVERVLWGNSQTTSSQGSDQEISIIAKSRKRPRRASSEASSPNDSMNEPRNRITIDLPNLDASVQTPNRDPASELWNRYSREAREKGQLPLETPFAQSFSHLLNSSSPPTPATHARLKESAGLRRSFSCGIEWPVSAAKRQKVSHGILGSGSVAGPGLGKVGESKAPSRIKELVEKLHKELITPVREDERDTGSIALLSSLPDLTSVIDAEIPKATKQITPVGPQQTSPHKMNVLLSCGSPSHDTGAQAIAEPDKSIDASSEYGEDDLGPDIIEAMRSAAATNQSQVNDNNIAHGSLSKVQKEARRLSCAPHFHERDHGEDFEDNVSDVCAADLEDVVALYDQSESATTKFECNDPKKLPNIQERIPPVKHNTKRSSVVEDVEEVSDDEYGADADFGECFDQDIMPHQGVDVANSGLPSLEVHSTQIQRFHVVNVVHGDYEFNDRTQLEKILHVADEQTEASKTVIIRQTWLDSPCEPGTIINVVGSFDKHGCCVVDDVQNMIILHPDHLISATVVADSFSCARRAILQDRIKATSEMTESQVYGHILHEIFQEAMKANRWDVQWMESTIQSIASRYLEDLIAINVDPSRAIDHLRSKATDLQAWAEVFVSAEPTEQAQVRDRGGAETRMSINKLLEVEEKVWSPMYGLKGNIDATVQTGKHSNAAHRAQTALYTLLLSNRYDINIACGILYYLESTEISRVPAIRHEIIHMIKKRNELAGYIKQKHRLPPVLGKSPHLCGKCYAQTACFVYHRLAENGTRDTSGMGDKFDDLVKHLKPIHQTFFLKWDELLTQEEKDIVKLRSELWNMQSVEREKVGRCFGGVVVDPASFDQVNEAPKINRFRYSFRKANAPQNFSFTESQITTGEPIVISDENGHFALASGYVIAVRKYRVDVAIDRQLHNARAKSKHFDPVENQSFTGIMEVAQSGQSHSTIVPTQPSEQITYRVDKDEFSNGMATVRNNLIAVMQKDMFGAQALRKLVIECVAPTFRSSPSAFDPSPTSSQLKLNTDQAEAIEKVMNAKDYALVLGMPGTGKTTTIAHIIRALTMQGKSILLTSYTHTAVDNILLKVRKYNIGVFRLGAVAKVHPEVQEFAHLAGTPMSSVEEIKQAYSQQVVATTCLGINHPIFNQRIFDYCIVDEASQITLPVCLGPIRMARTFILVGDHYQLPPLVQNKEALQGGLDVSLFKTLSDSHPESLTYLSHQYRMCEDIMTLSNALIYKGRLKCGTPAVAARSLQIPNLDAISEHHHTPATIISSPSKVNVRNHCLWPAGGTSCWLRDLVSPSVKACFLNTDPLLPSSREVLRSTRLTNPLEVLLTTQLVETLVTVGVLPSDIGVITLYRSQLALLKQSLRHHSSIEMHTADKFQGRDKEVILLSMVRSNEDRNVGDLLKDWRRVNVALTRARTKLIIVGSRDTLRGNELLETLTDLMETKGWRYDLPKGAAEMHRFEEFRTQVSELDSNISPKKESKIKAASEQKFFANPGASDHENKENQYARLTGPGQTKLTRPFRVPTNVGTKMNAKVLVEKRPVLRDIVNDAS